MTFPWSTRFSLGDFRYIHWDSQQKQKAYITVSVSWVCPYSNLAFIWVQSLLDACVVEHPKFGFLEQKSLLCEALPICNIELQSPDFPAMTVTFGGQSGDTRKVLPGEIVDKTY